MQLKKSKKDADGWRWRCSPKGCQKVQSIRRGTFFLESRIKIWELLAIILSFAIEFLNTAIRHLMGFAISTQTISPYKKCLRLTILTMFDKRNTINSRNRRKSFHQS